MAEMSKINKTILFDQLKKQNKFSKVERQSPPKVHLRCGILIGKQLGGGGGVVIHLQTLQWT